MAVGTKSSKLKNAVNALRALFAHSCAEPSVKRAWDLTSVRDLAGRLGPREKRMLSLFADGPRTVIGGKELAEKFGCSNPLDVATDLRRVSEFCAEQALPFPLAASGTGADSIYRMTWDYRLMDVFKSTVNRIDGPAAAAD